MFKSKNSYRTLLRLREKVTTVRKLYSIAINIFYIIYTIITIYSFD
jgi:hypothetical protein